MTGQGSAQPSQWLPGAILKGRPMFCPTMPKPGEKSHSDIISRRSSEHPTNNEPNPDLYKEPCTRGPAAPWQPVHVLRETDVTRSWKAPLVMSGPIVQDHQQPAVEEVLGAIHHDLQAMLRPEAREGDELPAVTWVLRPAGVFQGRVPTKPNDPAAVAAAALCHRGHDVLQHMRQFQPNQTISPRWLRQPWVTEATMSCSTCPKIFPRCRRP